MNYNLKKRAERREEKKIVKNTKLTKFEEKKL